MKVKEIRALLEAMEATGASEVVLETPDFKITVRRGSPAPAGAPAATAPAPTPAAPQPEPSPPPVPEPEAAPAEEPPASQEECPNCVVVKAPIVGTFYRRPAPDAEPYVKEGDRVEKGQVLCIIEAMKLFNEIESEVSGIVREILVEDAEPVEYGQPLFLIEPV